MSQSVESPRPAKGIKFADVPNGLAALGKAGPQAEEKKYSSFCFDLFSLDLVNFACVIAVQQVSCCASDQCMFPHLSP